MACSFTLLWFLLELPIAAWQCFISLATLGLKRWLVPYALNRPLAFRSEYFSTSQWRHWLWHSDADVETRPASWRHFYMVSKTRHACPSAASWLLLCVTTVHANEGSSNATNKIHLFGKVTVKVIFGHFVTHNKIHTNAANVSICISTFTLNF